LVPLPMKSVQPPRTVAFIAGGGMTTMQLERDLVAHYSRPAWTAELRRIEEQILASAGVTWS
jgi:hypothetical protein